MVATGTGVGTPLDDSFTFGTADFGLGVVTTPSIMTDTIFQNYGGNIGGLYGLASAQQRQDAYAIAEQQARQHLHTHLTPTTVTGSVSFSLIDQRYQLPLSKVITVNSVTAYFRDSYGSTYSYPGYGYLINGEASVVDLLLDQLGFGLFGSPFKYNVCITAGYPAGQLASMPNVRLALTIAGRMALQQIVDPTGGEGGPGNPGIKSVSDSGYSETRQDANLRMTAFGNTPEANYVAQLLNNSPLRTKRAMKLR